MYEITFRTRKAAHLWRYEVALHLEHVQNLFTLPTLMIRRNLLDGTFGKKRTTFTLEIPPMYADDAKVFFRHAVAINQ